MSEFVPTSIVTAPELNALDAASRDMPDAHHIRDITLTRCSGRLHVRFSAGYGTIDYWIDADGTYTHHAHL